MVTTSKHPLGRPPAQNGLDCRERLLDCAFSLFAAQGIAGTTVAQIARAAEVTPAMAHYYFSGRDGLIDAFVEERVAPVIRQIWNALPIEGGTPRQVLTAFVDGLLDAVDVAPELPQLWSREVMNAGGSLRQRLIACVPKERFALLCEALTAAQKAGTVRRDVIPGLALPAAMGIVMLPLAAKDMIEGIADVSFPDREHLRKHALAVLLDGMLTHRGAVSCS